MFRVYIRRGTIVSDFPTVLDAFLWLYKEKGGTAADMSRRIGFDILALDATRIFGRLERGGARVLHLYGPGFAGRPYGVAKDGRYDFMNRQTLQEVLDGLTRADIAQASED